MSSKPQYSKSSGANGSYKGSNKGFSGTKGSFKDHGKFSKKSQYGGRNSEPQAKRFKPNGASDANATSQPRQKNKDKYKPKKSSVGSAAQGGNFVKKSITERKYKGQKFDAPKPKVLTKEELKAKRKERRLKRKHGGMSSYSFLVIFYF